MEGEKEIFVCPLLYTEVNADRVGNAVAVGTAIT